VELGRNDGCHDEGLRSQNLGFLIVHGVAVIIENLPANLPVLDSELAVLETYLVAALERAWSAARPEFHISSALIERFAQTLREKLCFREIPMRKAYLSSIVDRVEVNDGPVHIMGPKDAIGQGVRLAANASNVVRSFIRDGSPIYQLQSTR
jgi:hypothetical protein